MVLYVIWTCLQQMEISGWNHLKSPTRKQATAFRQGLELTGYLGTFGHSQSALGVVGFPIGYANKILRAAPSEQACMFSHP